MKPFTQLTGKSSLLSVLIGCLGLLTLTASLNVNAGGRGHEMHHKSQKHHYSQHGHKQPYRNDYSRHDHRLPKHSDSRYYRTPSHARQGFGFNVWSFKPIVPKHQHYRSYRPDYHYHNGGERCYSSHTQLIINTR